MKHEAQTIEVANYLWPAGIAVNPPSAQIPYWRTLAERRLHYRDVVLGQDADAASRIGALHAAAIAELVREAEAARSQRDGVAMRAHVAAAARLCNEVGGQAPIPV
jgi:hypothetical protein